MEGKVPPPVEGGAAVGDHLVKVPKDQNQRVALQNSLTSNCYFSDPIS